MLPFVDADTLTVELPTLNFVVYKATLAPTLIDVALT